MGWLFTERPRNVKDYFRDQLTWESENAESTCLDIALKLNVMYAAVETRQKDTGDREVWAAVFLIKYIKGDEVHNFGYKDMEESMGPCQADAPKRILDLLTPTDNENALAWRRACRRRISRKAPEGAVIEFREPVSFTDGYEGKRFTVEMCPGWRRRRKALRAENGCLYRIRGLTARTDWVVVSETR